MSVNDNHLYIMNDIFNKMSKEFVTIDGNVKKIQKENLTPYKVATVILIREYCNEATKGTLHHANYGETGFLFSVAEINTGDKLIFHML
ncbi:hypothetical protein DMN91_003707 [Ooceraea biroi]|uniref:Uncharacterized protein n=1 Tax=Ooceraea biroi TaxID=2015173 RepID=A0A3L8DT79_OOCBI|nr:hypothetical protein DMN91_003707 [Ooceraea biroi]